MFNNSGGFTLNGGAFNNVNGNQYNNSNNTTNRIAGNNNEYRTENYGNNNVCLLLLVIRYKDSYGKNTGPRRQARRAATDGYGFVDEDEMEFYPGRPGLDHSATYPGYGRGGYDPNIPRYEGRGSYRGYEGYRGGPPHRGYGPGGYDRLPPQEYDHHDPYYRPRQEAYHNPQYAPHPQHYPHDPRRYPENRSDDARYPYPPLQDGYYRQAPPQDDNTSNWRAPTRPAPPPHILSTPGYIEEEPQYPDPQSIPAHSRGTLPSNSRQRGENDAQNRGTNKDADEADEEGSEARC
ncbi:hypothetical protein VNI00_012935 [Paramarasmius palmivorus]|uniref:Uncharacterized protein n=1 Tax=Paramarasmius palmivorus TaxID=297713 RepID=A0AAW0C1I2_9AGAR